MFEIAYKLYDAERSTGIPASTLRYFIRSGELPTCKVGRHSVIRRSSLEKFLARFEEPKHDEALLQAERFLEEGAERSDSDTTIALCEEAGLRLKASDRGLR